MASYSFSDSYYFLSKSTRSQVLVIFYFSGLQVCKPRVSKYASLQFKHLSLQLRPSSPLFSKKMLHPSLRLYHSLQKCNALSPTLSISLYLQLTHYFGKVAALSKFHTSSRILSLDPLPIISNSIPAVGKLVLAHYRGSQL